MENRKRIEKKVDAILWIDIAGIGENLIRFDSFFTIKYTDGLTLISILRDDEVILTFDVDDLKGKLRVKKIQNGTVEYKIV